MNPPKAMRKFWTGFLRSTGRNPDTAVRDILYLADTEAAANSLARLVLSGQKTATASLQWEYDVEGEPIPQAGDLSIVTTWNERPLCVIETTEVDIRPFDEVDAAFTTALGEDDGSVEGWRQSHWPHFERVCTQVGKSCTTRMPVVCQRFKVVFEHRVR